MENSTDDALGYPEGNTTPQTDTIADNPDGLERASAPAPYPKRLPPWSTPEARALRRLKRPFVRNYFRLSNFERGSLAQRATGWLLPWDFHRYPGRHRGLAQLLGVSVASADTYRRKGLLGRAAVSRLADEIERRAEAGLRIAAELRAEVERRRRVGRPRGLQIIGQDGLRTHQARRGRSKRRVVEAPGGSGESQ